MTIRSRRRSKYRSARQSAYRVDADPWLAISNMISMCVWSARANIDANSDWTGSRDGSDGDDEYRRKRSFWFWFCFWRTTSQRRTNTLPTAYGVAYDASRIAASIVTMRRADCFSVFFRSPITYHRFAFHHFDSPVPSQQKKRAPTFFDDSNRDSNDKLNG